MRKYLICFLLTYCLAGHATNSINVKKTELTRVTGQIQYLQQALNSTRQQQQNLEQHLKATELGISDLSHQIDTINQSATREQQQLVKLNHNQQIYLSSLSQQHAALAQQLRAAYKIERIQTLKVILNQDNPSTLQRHLNYYGSLLHTRLSSIGQAKQTLKSIKTNMRTITQHQDKLKSLLTQKQTQHEQQQTAQAQRQNLIIQLHQSVQTKEQQLSTLLANQKGLQEIISQLQHQTASGISGQPFNRLRGKLHWPVKGTIAANFGSALDVGDQHLNGVIINANKGIPVHAVYSGKVIFANWLRGFGLLVIINHGSNFMSLYGRNHALYAKVGDQVNTGDVIATTGNSGGYDKNSLYFEIRQNGNPINPNAWCR